MDSPDEAIRWRRLSLEDENHVVSPDGLIRAKGEIDLRRRAQALLSRFLPLPLAAGISPGAWTWIGPGNIGGRVRTIAIHPTTTSTIFAGSVGGGIWKTVNGGASWAAVDDFMANLAVTSILFTPGNPSVMYAGTGEGFSNQDSIQGAGVFKSTDGGRTWNQLASTAGSDFAFVNRLAMSTDGATLLAGTKTGLFRSPDGGVTFTNVLTPTPSTEVYDLHFLSGSSLNGVASGRYPQIYYTSDGGLTWTKSTGLPATSSRIELGVSVSSPATVYALVDASSGQLWKSTDGGVTFSFVSTPAHLGNQGWYDNAIWVAPDDPNRLVVGGQYLATTANGGATWTKLGYYQYIHPDHHAIVSDPNYGVSNHTVYFGNDGGIYTAADVTTVFATGAFTSLNNNLGITQFYGIGGNQTSGKVIGGTQDNGTLLYTPSLGANGWTETYGGDGGFSAADPTDVNYLYGEYVYLAIHRSTDGGASAAPIFDGENGANFISPFVLDPNDPNRLLGGGASLWRSNNARAPTPTWWAIKSPSGSPISAIAVTPYNADVIWVGHNNGSVYRTSNGTSRNPAWTRVGADAVPGRMVTRITVDPTNINVVYVTLGGFISSGYLTGNIWKTTDGGATWAAAAGSGVTALPALPVHSVAIHPSNAQYLYAATELGVFASSDAGATWSLPQDGPANVAVDDLIWMGTTLVAATHGRGLFSIDVTPPAGVPQITSHPAGTSITVGHAGALSVTATGAGLSYQWLKNGLPVSGATNATLTFSLASTADAGTYRAVVRNASGSVVSNGATLAIGNGPGAPIITLQPSDAARPFGTTVTLSVVAAGSAPLSYQWRRDGELIASATTDSLVLSNLQAADDGSYDVVVTNPEGVTTSSPAVVTATSGYTFSTLAGVAGVNGILDGPGVTARFGYPQGLVVDVSGNVYVIDASGTSIRKITPAGYVSTVAGAWATYGSADGNGAAAQFNWPAGIAIDANGTLYVADTYNHTIRKITTDREVTTIAGSPGLSGSADGTGSDARFRYPDGIAVDSALNVYVADTYNHTIRKITPQGVVTTLAGLASTSDTLDGTGSAARFYRPEAIAIDRADTLFVVSGDHTVRSVTSGGVVTTLAGTALSAGSADGIGVAARFRNPTGISVDAAGNLYVAESGNSTIRRVAPDRRVTTIAGVPGVTGAANGSDASVSFNHPWGVASNAGGVLYVADTRNYIIRKGTWAVAPTLATITPDNGHSGDVVNVTLTGSNVLNNMSVRLMRPFSADIVATNVQRVNASTLTATVDLSTAVEGTWTPVATHSAGDGGQSALLTDAFTVVDGPPRPPNIVTQPVSQLATARQHVVFTVSAGGNPLPAYRWQSSTNGGASFADLTDGATYNGSSTASLTVVASVALSGVQLRATATNALGSATSTVATLTVTAAAWMGAAAGFGHSCAVVNGGLKCWGLNANGEMADGSVTERHTPVDVTGLTSGVVGVAAGGFHACALTTAGGVKCWGFGEAGLGDGTQLAHSFPVDVTGLDSGVAAIAAGQHYTCALMRTGGVKCWGRNLHGQLGDGTTTDRSVPVDVSGLASGVIALAASSNHTCALMNDGGVRCWGANSFGQLGDGTLSESTVPVAVSGLAGVSAIAAGIGHTCALTSGGSVKCWGLNQLGQLGDGTTLSRPMPVDVAGLNAGVVAIAAGAFTTCAGTSGGGLKCWGDNTYGQVGDGTTAHRSAPTSVIGVSSLVTAIAMGDTHNCAVFTSGAVVCWGRNQYGQLGDGTVSGHLTPVGVDGIPYAPSITTDPSNQTVATGSSAAFTVAAAGAPAPAYAWQVSTDGGGSFTSLTDAPPYSGTTSMTLTVAATPSLSGYRYRAVATNSQGGATSAAAALSVNVGPAITLQPANQTVATGSTATFVVAASGTPAPTYQWQVSTDGGGSFMNVAEAAPHSGTTSTTLTVAVSAGVSANQYRAVATNSVSAATSTAATLSLTTVPGAPLEVSATAGDARASIAFRAPASDGGRTITSYTVTSSPGSLTATAAIAPIVVSGLTNGVSYTFTVTATNALGIGPASSPSAPVMPSTFIDADLAPSVTVFRVAHITELHARVDALRTRYGLRAFDWTDATLTAGVSPIRAQHIMELRAALNDVYVLAGRVAPVYTDPLISPGVSMKAAHILELRTAVIAIE